MPLPALDEAQELRCAISSLAELDALVGTHLTKETPQTHWEDSRTHCQFATVEEALDAMHDLFFREYVSQSCIKPTVLTEIREFRHYSSDLNLAWSVVEQIPALHDLPVEIRRQKSGGWRVQFGHDDPVQAATTSIALCVAALQSSKIYVELRVAPGGIDGAQRPDMHVVFAQTAP